MKNFFTTSLALFAAFAAAFPTSAPAEDASFALSRLENRAATCSRGATDKLLFKVSMKSFQKSRKAKNPSKCVWKSDNCSKSPDKPRGYNFVPSCQRHDFGYRNTKKQKRFTKAMKKRIDNNFKKDLYKYCAGFKGWKAWKGVECRRLADVYVGAVRKFGKRDLEYDEQAQTYRRGEEVEVAQTVKRGEESEEYFEDFDGSEVDPDIEGEEMPEDLGDIADLEDEDIVALDEEVEDVDDDVDTE